MKIEMVKNYFLKTFKQWVPLLNALSSFAGDDSATDVYIGSEGYDVYRPCTRSPCG
jgi:hypothetical protein